MQLMKITNLMLSAKKGQEINYLTDFGVKFSINEKTTWYYYQPKQAVGEISNGVADTLKTYFESFLKMESVNLPVNN